MGVGGMTVVERLESDASGLLTNWIVVSERTLDEDGSHSWTLLSRVPSDAPWRPSDLYRFEGSSFSTELAAGETAGATPEPSTWMMMLMGFAGLFLASYRRARTGQASILREGTFLQ
jgi:PEP-CTERM motif